MNAITQYELTITRLINAPPEQVYKAWINPEMMKEWFCPRPWRVTHVENDVRAGGSSYVLMKGPNGEEFPNRGVYLEVIPGKKLVFTDAYVSAWIPAEKPFMTGVLTFENEGGKTRYTAKVYHWTEADMKQHEQMGFHDGWGKATDQLELLLAGKPIVG
ncbi:MAG: SRPBCC family protein [Steroidobacteraceae bacterium]